MKKKSWNSHNNNRLGFWEVDSGSKILKTKSTINRFKNESVVKRVQLYWAS